MLIVFFLGGPFLRRQDNHHTFAIHAGQLLSGSVLFQFFQEAKQQEFPAVFKYDGAAPELDIRFYLVAVGQEIFGVSHLEFKIVVARLRTKTDLFEFHLGGVRLHLLLFFPFLVKELVIVGDANNRGDRIRGNFHQIEFYILRPFQDFGRRKNTTFYRLANHLADFSQIVAHEAHLWDTNKVVDTVFRRLLATGKRWARSLRTWAGRAWSGRTRAATDWRSWAAGATTGGAATTVVAATGWAVAATAWRIGSGWLKCQMRTCFGEQSIFSCRKVPFG